VQRWLPFALVLTGCFSDPTDPISADSDNGSSGPANGSTTDEGGSASDGGELPGSSTTGDESDSMGESSSTGDTFPPECGNGIVEPGERCDGADPMGAACLDDCRFTCLDAFDDCDELPANGCEIDTATDANNCGGCGQVCASGVCIDAACAPTNVVEGIGQGPTRIARSGDTLVFDESGFGRIWSWEIGTEAPSELVADQATGTFRRFALTDDRLYWADGNQNSVFEVPLAGGSPSFVFSIGDAGAPFANAQGLYFPETRVEALDQVSALLRLQPGETEPETLVDTLPGMMCQVTSAGGRLILGTTNFDDPVRSIDNDGMAAPVSVSVLPQDACNRPIFGVGPSIYFAGRATEAGPTGLVRHNVGTGVSTLLIEPLTFDGIGDYYVSQHGIVLDIDGEIRAYDAMGNDPNVIATISEASYGRYIDDQIVAWTEPLADSNGWVLRVAERP